MKRLLFSYFPSSTFGSDIHHHENYEEAFWEWAVLVLSEFLEDIEGLIN